MMLSEADTIREDDEPYFQKALLKQQIKPQTISFIII